jgi:hypothetical protein
MKSNNITKSKILLYYVKFRQKFQEKKIADFKDGLDLEKLIRENHYNLSGVSDSWFFRVTAYEWKRYSYISRDGMCLEIAYLELSKENPDYVEIHHINFYFRSINKKIPFFCDKRYLARYENEV